jgi:hypothetical protein
MANDCQVDDPEGELVEGTRRALPRSPRASAGETRKCDPPSEPLHAFDRRPLHPLTPINVTVEITDALRALGAVEEVTVPALTHTTPTSARIPAVLAVHAAHLGPGYASLFAQPAMRKGKRIADRPLRPHAANRRLDPVVRRERWPTLLASTFRRSGSVGTLEAVGLDPPAAALADSRQGAGAVVGVVRVPREGLHL